jgi:hypothetical protein
MLAENQQDQVEVQTPIPKQEMPEVSQYFNIGQILKKPDFVENFIPKSRNDIESLRLSLQGI